MTPHPFHRAGDRTMDCDRARGLLIERADGLLTGGAKLELDEHLAACARCSGALEGLVEASMHARGAARFRAPEGFASRVMERIGGLDDEPGLLGWLWSMPSYMKFAQAAAAVAVVVTGVYSASFLTDRLAAQGLSINGDASLVASVQAEYLDPVPPDSIGEAYLSTEENGNEN